MQFVVRYRRAKLLQYVTSISAYERLPVRANPRRRQLSALCDAPAMGLLAALVADLQALGAEAAKRKLTVLKEVRFVQHR